MIEIRSVHKWYGEHHILDDVSLEVHPGTMCLLCGPSGVGKSTLLSTVNQIQPIDKGEIWVDGERVDRLGGKKLRELRKKVGVVYQSFNLFGHLDAEGNIRLGLEKGLGLPKKKSAELAERHLERVGLADHRHKFPSELSGGQQQRVAIARCLAMSPKVMLLDEPTSALDVDNQREVVDVIRALVQIDGITILLATHQVHLFADLADCFACMTDGKITDVGSLHAVMNGSSKIKEWMTAVKGPDLPPPPRSGSAA